MAQDLLSADINQLRSFVEDLSRVYDVLPITAAGTLQQIAQKRLDALLELLDLDLIFLRLYTYITPAPIEVLQRRASSNRALSPKEVGAALDAGATMPGAWPRSLEVGGLELEAAVMPLGVGGGLGLLLCGAARAGFPRKTEGLLLNAAASQLAVELQDAMLSGMRRKIEDIPHDKEEMLHQLVDSIAAEVTLSTPEGRIVVVNRTCVERTGRPFDRHSEWATGDLLHPDDLPRVKAEWARAVSKEDHYEVEVRSKCADGVYRWVHSHGFPIREADGHIFRWCTLHLDINDRKRAEQALSVSEDALAASERNLNQIVSVMPGLVWSADPDGSAVFLNQHYLDYVGLPLEQMLGSGYFETIHPDDRERQMADWRGILVSERPGQTEARIRRFDGEYRWFLFRGSPVCDAAGRVTKWHGVNTDIEDQKRAEQILRASEALLAEREQGLRQIIDTIPAMAWTADPHGVVNFFNRNFLDYVGQPLEGMRDGGWKDAVHPDDIEHLLGTWAIVMNSSRTGEAEARLRRSDGVYRWFLMRVSPLRDDMGNVVRWYGVNVDIDDLKSAERRLAASEKKLTLIIDTIPALVWSAREDGSTDFVNQHYLDYVGMTMDEVKDWGFVKAVHPDDAATLVANWQRVRETGRVGQNQARLRRADGEYRWFLFRGQPLIDEDGGTKWFGLNIDIEDLKRTEEALAASERKLDAILRAMPAQAWSTNPDGTADFFNQHQLDYVGLPLEAMAGTGFVQTFHPDDAERILGVWRDMMASGRSGEVEGRMRCFDGTYRWFLFRAAPVLDETGKVVKWYGVNTDINDQKRAEEILRASEAELAASERNLRQILNTIPGVVWSAQKDGFADYFNEHYLQYVGRSVEDVQGWGWTNVIHPDDVANFAEVWSKALAVGRGDTVEARLRRADGVYRWFLFRANALYDENGKVARWYGVNTDIDDLKRAEEELRDAQGELAHVTRVMTMGHLTASIAHELNQPLAGIITNASTCLRMLAANPPNISGASETARRTIRDGNRAAEVITRLRALFKKGNTATEAVDLNAAIQEVIALTTTELQRNNVGFRVDLADDLPLVRGDRVQLQQVVMNLILNAVEAMEGITGRAKELRVATERDEADGVRVAVQDAGVGIDGDTAEKLFNPFYSTKSEGMGIGLSVSRSIIEHHKGRLWVESNAGPGTTFLVSIPSNPEATPAYP